MPRVSALNMTEEENWMYDAHLGGHPVRVVVDSFASHNFMAAATAKTFGFVIEDTEDMEVELGDKTVKPVTGKMKAILNIEGYMSTESVYLLDMKPDDDQPLLIIGRAWLKHRNPDIIWSNNALLLTRSDGSRVKVLPRARETPERTKVLKRMSFKKMARVLWKGNCELYMARITECIPTHSEKVKATDDFKVILTEYENIFREDLPEELPPTRGTDFEINLKPGEPPPVRPVIRLSPNELKELKAQIQKYLDRGLLRPSSSPYGAPVFFIKKTNGDLRMVFDYRALNKITIPDSSPIPLIDETIDQVAGANIFSQLHLIWGYHQMRLKEEDCHKTAIRTRFGSFEWRVLCFGLTNAPAAFSRLLSNLFQELLGECMVLYLDDILIYSKSREEHRTHLRKVFNILRRHKLYLRPSKCNFGLEEVEYLGYNVSSKGIATQQL